MNRSYVDFSNKIYCPCSNNILTLYVDSILAAYRLYIDKKSSNAVCP